MRNCSRQGKKLYYISDMYLPQTQIDAMLRRCGYPAFDGGLVSSTYGVQKRSGKLFRQFLHETELDARPGAVYRGQLAGGCGRCGAGRYSGLASARCRRSLRMP